jgi:hypothetical protein
MELGAISMNVSSLLSNPFLAYQWLRLAPLTDGWLALEWALLRAIVERHGAGTVVKTVQALHTEE